MGHAYPLVTTSDEFVRLTLQSNLYRRDADTALTHIGVQAGWRCLDLCCGIGGITDVLSHHVGLNGHVVGLDYDAEKLAFAREWAKSNGLNRVEYIQGDGFATGLEPQSFDLVHVRYALGIVPNGIGMLDHALSLVRPGGWIFLEEADAQSLGCYPPHAAWDRAVEAMFGCFDEVGSDIYLGRKLNHLLVERGLELSLLRPCTYILRSGEPMMYHVPWTLAAMRDAVHVLGLMDEAALDETVQVLTEHLSQPGTVSTGITMVQAAAQVG